MHWCEPEPLSLDAYRGWRNVYLSNGFILNCEPVSPGKSRRRNARKCIAIELNLERTIAVGRNPQLAPHTPHPSHIIIVTFQTHSALARPGQKRLNCGFTHLGSLRSYTTIHLATYSSESRRRLALRGVAFSCFFLTVTCTIVDMMVWNVYILCIITHYAVAGAEVPKTRPREPPASALAH